MVEEWERGSEDGGGGVRSEEGRKKTIKKGKSLTI